jgi:hypothetical protein
MYICIYVYIFIYTSIYTYHHQGDLTIESSEGSCGLVEGGEGEKSKEGDICMCMLCIHIFMLEKH